MSTEYEYAPLTTMQAVARLSIALSTCAEAAEEMVTYAADIQAALLDAARLADFLGEHTLSRSIAILHASTASAPIDTVDPHKFRANVLRLNQLWDTCLRETNLKYTPSSI